MLVRVTNWYLIETLPRRERWVCEQIRADVNEILSPMLKGRIIRGRRLAFPLQPLFPGYVFAEFNLAEKVFSITHTPGVRGLVSAGLEPLSVPASIITDLKRRCPGGLAEIKPPKLVQGQSVRVIHGPLQGLNGIFQHYLSGRERVVIMLDAIRYSARIALPATEVALGFGGATIH